MIQQQTEMEFSTLPEGVLLALDTSTAVLSAALLRGGEVLEETNVEGERNHSIHLVPVIRDMVRAAGLAMSDIAAVAVGQGPGSYTGIRIGVTVAKTMAWTLQVPLIGVSSLQALGYGAALQHDGEAWIVPLMDARRGQVYAALFHSDPSGVDSGRVGGIDRRTDDGIVLLADLLQELRRELQAAEEPPRAILFAGDAGAFERQLSEFADSVAGGSDGSGASGAAIYVGRMEGGVSAANVGAIAYRKWQLGDVEDVHAFAPNYTQLAEAEVKLRAKQAESRQG